MVEIVTVAIASVSGYTITPASKDAMVYVDTVATPVISGSNKFIVSQEITMTTTTIGATIYYTLDDSVPQVDVSHTVESGVAFLIGLNTVVGTIKIRAIAVKAGILNSAEATKTFTKERVLTTVLVESAGKSFDVGEPEGSVGATVTFTKDLYMGASEVTQGQYYDVMTKLAEGSRRPSANKGTNATDWRDLPVETVTWSEATAPRQRPQILVFVLCAPCPL